MYDVIFIADIYVPGGTNFQLAQNIRHLSSTGKRIGIIPVQLPHAKGSKAINRFVREALSDRRCEVVDDQAADIVRTRHLIVDNPRLMAADVSLKTKIVAGRIVILVPFPPQDGVSRMTFDPGQVMRTVGRIADGEVIWAPVSNLVRTQLKRFFPELPLSELNAHPIVDIATYRFSAELRDRKRILIGRHSRPEPDKWPSSRSQFLKIYPAAAPFDVKFLGIDAASLSSMIGSIPENFSVLPYDSVAVPKFLSGIDFFVYYHHKSWVEAFGIAIAEAMAAGALCILPRYMEANFAEAAIYAAPNEVRDVLCRLHRNPRKYREQARFARNFVKRHFSRNGFSDFADEIGITAAPAKRSVGQSRQRYESVYLSDFSSPKVFNYAFVDELSDAAARGVKVAACDIRDDLASGTPTAVHAFEGGRVRLLGLDERVRCDELIINDPWRLVANRVDLGRFEPGRTTCLVSYPHGNLAGIQRYFALHPQFQPTMVSWEPRDSHSRIWLESFDPNLPLAPANRAVQVSASTTARLDELRRSRPITIRRTIGFVGIENSDDANWIRHILPALEADPAPILVCFGDREAALDPRILCSGYRGIDLVKWVSKLDRLIVLRDRLKGDNLDYLIALCRHAGVPVYYRWRNNKERTSGSSTLEGMEKAELRSLLLGAEAPSAAQPPCAGTEGPLRLIGHAVKLNGHSRPVANGAISGPRVCGAKPALLFVSQNGTGVGHVVRLLSIARRMADRYDCLFLTMSQAVAFISAFGFHAEYFPSSVYSGVSYTDWLHWLRRKIDLMLDAWGVRAVVFDGNVPYAALAEAAGSRPNVSSVWIRRGMWPDSEEDRRRLRSQSYFDIIIEPRDFAENLDEGPTRELRDTVHLVPPIQLLGPGETMSRSEACANSWHRSPSDECSPSVGLRQQPRHAKSRLKNRGCARSVAECRRPQSSLADIGHPADAAARRQRHRGISNRPLL